MIAAGVTVQLDQVRVALAQGGTVAKQARYAAMLMVNRLVDEANAEIRVHYPEHFHARDPRLLKYLAPVRMRRENYATKENLTALMATAGKSSLLAPFETGEPHVMRSHDQPVAIPTGWLRPTPAAVIPRRWYPSSLGLTPRRDPSGKYTYALGKGSLGKHKSPVLRTAGGGVTIQGKQGTFVIDPLYHPGAKPEQWGVYIRVGPGRGGIRMLWRYLTMVPRPANLQFFRTIDATVQRRALPNWQGAWELALRTAR